MSLTSSGKASPRAILFAIAQVILPATTASAVYARREPQLVSRQTYAPTEKGCFSSPGGSMQVAKSSIYQSSGQCETTCTQLLKPVMALQEDNCYCGDLLPSPSSQVSTTACNSYCPGYDAEPCGGESAYTVWLTGVDDSVGSVSGGRGSDGDETSTQPSSSVYTPTTTPTHTPTHTPTPPKHHFHPKPNPSSHTSHKTQPTPSPVVYTTTENRKTIVKTVPGPSGTSQSDTSSGSSGSPNVTTIGIAVGVVAGVLLLVGLIAGVLFYLRRRRRMKNAENGHRRADSLNAFVAAGGHVPGSMAASRIPTVTINDNRLDPRMMQETRRASAGSYLADNEDYSRRILKVTNPDGT